MASILDNGVVIRQIRGADRAYVNEVVTEYFGSSSVVSRGRLHHCEDLSGMVAVSSGNPVGLLLYEIREDALEVVSLVSEIRGAGIGRGLLENLINYVRSLGGIERCWLITSNNNHNAINFYHHVGWHHTATHRGAINQARALKPDIPVMDDRGIAIEDELEFEFKL